MTKRKYCERCKRPIKVCFCGQITTLENHWPVYIFQHFKENRHPLGTACIAKLSLGNCQILITNNIEYENKRNALLKQQPLLIFPGKDSEPIETLELDNPRPLIFLDGTWRKTRRLLHESPVLSQLKKISFEPVKPSRYRIRKTPAPQALSTLEAIVYVLSVLEKNQAKYQPLLDTMDQMINKQIEMMGENTFKRNYNN